MSFRTLLAAMAVTLWAGAAVAQTAEESIAEEAQDTVDGPIVNDEPGITIPEPRDEAVSDREVPPDQLDGVVEGGTGLNTSLDAMRPHNERLPVEDMEE